MNQLLDDVTPDEVSPLSTTPRRSRLRKVSAADRKRNHLLIIGNISH